MNTDITTLLQHKKIVELKRNQLPDSLEDELLKIIDCLDLNCDTHSLHDSDPNCQDPMNKFLNAELLHSYITKGINHDRNINGRFTTFSRSNLHRRLTPHIRDLFPKHSISNTGNIIYHKGDFMGWHTNSNFEGCRLYFTHCDADYESFFRYYDDKADEIVTLWDKKGINIRLFRVSKEDPLWHCVWSNCTRISLGYFVLDNLI